MQSSIRSKAVDPRPARTRASIYAAVAKLTDEPGQDISVNAIIRTSGVSRSGFYAHFTGLDDVLVTMFSDAYRDIAATYAGASDAESVHAVRHAQEQLVAFISKRWAFVSSSLDWPVSSRANEVVIQAHSDGIRAAIQARGDAAPAGIDIDDMSTFIAGGVLAVLTRWIREGDAAVEQSVVVDRLLAVMPGWLTGSS
jgi:AcrR family transcriptional regulator